MSINNRVTLTGKVLDAPKTRSFEARGGTIEIVSLWFEVRSDERVDRFTVEINCPKAAETAKAMRAGVVAEITGALRHDRYKHKVTGEWKSKFYIAIDPGAGVLRSQGLADEAQSQSAVNEVA